MDQLIIKRADGGVSIAIAPKDPETTFRKWSDTADAAWLPATWRIADVSIPDRTFRNAWTDALAGPQIDVDLMKARAIHVERIVGAQASEIARLQVSERRERLLGNAAKGAAHAANRAALEALDLNTLATRIQAAPNPTALASVWPALIPR